MKLFCSVKSTIKNEHGMALLLVLLMMTIFMVLGTSLIGLSINNTKSSAGERDYESVYYVAEAGAAEAFMQAEKTVINIKNTIDSPHKADFYAAVDAQILSPAVAYPPPNFDEAFGQDPSVATSVTKVAEGTYNITAVGTVGNHSRTVKKTFSVTWQDPINFAVYANHYYFGSGGANITGNIGLSSTSSTFTDHSGAASVSGNIYVPRGWSWGSLLGKTPVAYEGTVPIALPAFPAEPNDYKQDKSKLILDNKTTSDTWTLTANQKLTEITISHNAVLTIDTGTSDRALIVDSLTLQSGTINIVGSGKLTIYVKKSFTMASSSKINFNKNTQADVEKLILYVADDKLTSETPSISIGGSNKLHGSLYLEKGTLNLGGSGVIEGHVFTGGEGVTVGNSAEVGSDLYPSLFYAPKANFKIANGAEVMGSIIANQFDGSGGKVYQGLINYKNVPYYVRPVTPVIKEGLVTTEPVRES